MDILEEIVARKRVEVERFKEAVPAQTQQIQRRRILRACDIAASDNRHRDGLLHSFDASPVGPPRVVFLAGPPVHCDGRSPGVLRRLCNRDGRFAAEALADLDRNGLWLCLHHRRDDVIHKLRILHKRRTFAVVHDLRHRASHIHIEKCKRQFRQHLRLLGQYLRVRSEELQPDGLFRRVRSDQLRGVRIMIHHALGADHFRIQKPRALLLAKKPEREVGNPGHGP